MARTLIVLFGGPEKDHLYVALRASGDSDWCTTDLTAETVQRAALALQGVDHIHGGDGLALGVLGVGDGITDNVLQKHLQHTARLLVDQARDTLHTATTSQPTDGGLRDTLDVITQHLAMPLRASFAQTFASLAATSHIAAVYVFALTKNEIDVHATSVECEL